MKISPHEIYKLYLLRVKKTVAALGSYGGQTKKVLDASEKTAIEAAKNLSKPSKKNQEVRQETQRILAEPSKKLNIV